MGTRKLTLLLLLLPGAAAGASMVFEDVAASRGVDFLHQDGSSGLKHFVETASGGGGWLDFDGDGLLDLYLVNGSATPGSQIKVAPSNRLFRNVGGHFEDVTERAGVGDTGYGMGFCAGDFDGDGKLDFMVTNHGPDRLYRNRGDGRFEEVGEAAGVADSRWSTGCAFGDLNGDGHLDLYVSRYARFDFDKSPFCGDRARDIRAYCNPSAYPGERDSLYINDGHGRFVDRAADSGIHIGDKDRGFGVLLSDLNGDGWLDIYVANDGSLNRLYVNDGKGRFDDQGLISGAGLNARGMPEAGMGLDIADLGGDGLPEILVSNFSMESNTLYRNLGGLMFEDVTSSFGIAEVSFRYVGWGLQWFDADNDGDLDYAVANGHPIDNIEQFEPGLSYQQPNQLFENVDGGSFRSAGEGEVWRRQRASRGLAAGDFDNDGRIDLLVTNSRGQAELLHNRSDAGHWIGLRLVGAAPNTFALGARVALETPAGMQYREVHSGGGYLTQRDLRLHFGLGPHSGKVGYTVRWPNGEESTGRIDALDRYVDIHQNP